jgi:hypothetical protein
MNVVLGGRTPLGGYQRPHKPGSLSGVTSQNA